MKMVLPFMLLFFSMLSYSQEGILNKLLAPGPLMKGHEDLEASDCLKCHGIGEGIDKNKCLDCHKELKPFVANKKGFHGMTLKTCIECHSDHKGKDYDSTKVDEKTFDHKKTGYDLKGKHAELKCKECHTGLRDKKPIRPTGIRYFGNTTTCVSCHKKHDIHFFKDEFAKKDCDQCHGLQSWKTDIKFDHKVDAKYELLGKHKELKCAKCHTPTKDRVIYKWSNLTKDKCLACHADFHKNNLSQKFKGKDCSTCHTNLAWKIEKFEHSVTGYKLKGKHAVTKCFDCHKQEAEVLNKNFRWAGLKTQCLSCHKDFHEYGKHQSSRFPAPNKCENCHNDTNWKQIVDFQHNRDTRFLITGKHSIVQCNKCHIRPKVEVPPRMYFWKELDTKTCENCHKNPHTKTFSKEFLAKKCTDCHSPEGWKISPTRTNKNFKHQDTRFPLTGSHIPVACSTCHNKGGQQIFKFPSYEKQFCIDCHKSPHKDQFNGPILEKSCNDCHNTKKFDQLKPFDHNQSHFKLVGKHNTLKCSECHKKTKMLMPIKQQKFMHQFKFPDVTNKTCTKCHSDYHKGQFEQSCQECHNENDWKKVKFDHNTGSDFKLRGKHESVKCAECHKPSTSEKILYKNERRPLIIYKPLPMTCYNCHYKKDVHKGDFGKACQDCHNESNWKSYKDFHQNFTLYGVHYSLSCNECHTDNRRLGGMSDNCFLCHQKDDVHYGSIPNCGTCHRQDFWEQTTFRHSITNFPLRGSHRTLECINCHSTGIYEGTPSRCVDCHLQDALGATSQVHTLPAFENCKECHNQFIFNISN
jgi:hypothetical protein